MKRLFLLFAAGLLFAPVRSAAQGSGPAFDSALRAIRGIADPTARVNALWQLESRADGATTAQFISLDEALLAAHEARVGDDSSRLTRHVNLGLELTDAGRYDEALAHFNGALPIAQRLKHRSKAATAYTGLGFLYKCIGEITRDTTDFRTAMAYYEQAAALATAPDLASQRPGILMNKAQLYDLQHQPRKALLLYRQAELLLRRSPQQEEGLIQLYVNMGISLKNDRQYEGALQAYQNALDLLDRGIGNGYKRVVLNANLATLYEAMGRTGEAEALGRTVYQDAARSGLHLVQADAARLLARIYESRRQYPQALVYTRRLLDVKDTLLNEEKAAQLATMQTRFDVAGKNEQLAAQTGVIARGRVQAQYLWAGLALLAGTGTVFYTGRRRARRLNRRILQQQAELEAQKTELQHVNALKDRLFSVIGHDLRTPVNALASFTVLLEAGTPSPDRLRQYTASLKGTLDRTGGLLENLLHFARTQIQGAPPVLQDVPVSGVAEDVVRLLQYPATAKQVVVETDLPEGLTVRADSDMLALLLRNLLGNAIKFSHAGGRVGLTASTAPGTVQLRVQDYGVGMVPDAVHRFNTAAGIGDLRSESAYGTGGEKGTGLGLVLCKTFVGLLGGTIRINSTEQSGTTVTVTLSS